MKHESRRFNLLDWAILTLLAAALALFGFLFWHRERTIEPLVGIECVLRLPASENEVPVQVGDVVRNENGTVRFGEVRSVFAYPYKEFYLQKGALIYGTVPEMRETEITVRMVAARGIDYRVGDIRVSAGELGNYRIGGAFFSGVRVVSLEEIAE